MKKKNWIFPLIIGLLLMITSSCSNKKNETVTDADGNVYSTITIGTQVWMVENLKTTKYRNGDPIPNILDNTQWGNLTTGAFCNYENKTDNANIYGRLYNWYAISDIRNLAPQGWHVATDAEWKTLTDFLGSKNTDYPGGISTTITIAGGKLKEAGLTHWKSPNTDATNEVGFTALPGGQRSSNYGYGFGRFGWFGIWWTSTAYNATNAWCRYINNDSNDMYRTNDHKEGGYSVRCIRDN